MRNYRSTFRAVPLTLVRNLTKAEEHSANWGPCHGAVMGSLIHGSWWNSRLNFSTYTTAMVSTGYSNHDAHLPSRALPPFSNQFTSTHSAKSAPSKELAHVSSFRRRLLRSKQQDMETVNELRGFGVEVDEKGFPLTSGKTSFILDNYHFADWVHDHWVPGLMATKKLVQLLNEGILDYGARRVVSKGRWVNEVRLIWEAVRADLSSDEEYAQGKLEKKKKKEEKGKVLWKEKTKAEKNDKEKWEEKEKERTKVKKDEKEKWKEKGKEMGEQKMKAKKEKGKGKGKEKNKGQKKGQKKGKHNEKGRK